MLCFVLWASCYSFLSIKFYVCTWVDLLFVNTFKSPSIPRSFVGLQGLIAKNLFGSNLPWDISESPLPTIHVKNLYHKSLYA
jgi:hypothetical protein